MSFVGVRYVPKRSITAEELDYLSACVGTLLDRTQSLGPTQLDASSRDDSRIGLVTWVFSGLLRLNEDVGGF